MGLPPPIIGWYAMYSYLLPVIRHPSFSASKRAYLQGLRVALDSREIIFLEEESVAFDFELISTPEWGVINEMRLMGVVNGLYGWV